LNQSIIIENTRLAGMAVTAYCGMAIGRVFTDATLAGIAAHHGKGIAQVVLRWLIQQDGVVALSRSVNPQRVAENVAIFDFELDREEMQAIHGLARSNSRIVDPPGLAPSWD
jgi:2,5-diketo-D-gluconate reductase B